MKKIIILMSLAAIATTIKAQLVVDSLGRVGVGTETPKSMLSVGAKGNDGAVIYCYATENKYGIHSRNYVDDEPESAAGNFYTQNTLGVGYGIKGTAKGSNTTTPDAIGIGGYANLARNSVGVYGGCASPSMSAVNFAGIYGSETSLLPTFATAYSGIYAGFFNGKVRVTNGIYATLLSPSTSSSLAGQNGTTILSNNDESVTDKLSGVQTLQFLRDIPDINEEGGEENAVSEPCLSPVQYGLDADQLKTVYPELVYEDANGNVSINYVEMVPLLVQSINELKAEVAELKGTSPRKAKAQPTAIEETVSDVDMVRMDQNKPNPFSESTVIALNIPSNAQTSNIYIYDMSGKQVQSLPVSERGETNITVYARDLTAGMYIYTLIVDGRVAVTRRMIVTI